MTPRRAQTDGRVAGQAAWLSLWASTHPFVYRAEGTGGGGALT